jgi:hypothetical protein
VISDELLLGGGVHAVERVEGASEVTFEGVASLDDLGHDLVTLLVGDAGSEGDTVEVTADADTGGADQSGTFLRERRAVKLGGVHVGNVLVCGLVTMVVLDDLVEEASEGLVGVSGAGVAADTGVNVLATREDAGLE